MSINTLPQVSSSQMKAMNKIAEEKFGVTPEEYVAPAVMNPMLQHHEEPVMQVEQEQEELPVVEEESIEEEIVEEIKETPNQRNIRSLREKAERTERAERERDEMMKRLYAYEQGVKPQVEKPVETEEDYLATLGIDADALAEGKHLKPLMKELRSLKNELNQYKKQTQQETIEVRLKTRFPDFDKVVSQSNLEMLRHANPELAEAILATPDQFKQATLAYQMVKQYGIYQEDNFTQEKVLAQKNAAKPKPLASVSPQQGESPMSKANAFANGLTSDLKAQLLREMNQYKKGF
jgi:hypothetical protein